MLKEKSRTLSKVLLLVIALILALTSFCALSSSTVCAEEKLGISLSKPIVTSYQKDQKITVNGKEYTDIPYTVSGKLLYSYKDTKSNKMVSREIDIEQAVINGINNDSTKDRITFDGFSTTEGLDTSKKSTSKKMILKFTPKEATSITYELEIEYRIYTSAESMAGMQQLTEMLSKINKVLDNILAPLLIVMASVGMIFAIFLGVKLARANNAEERDEAKKRVIYTVVGIAVCLALILIFKLFARYSIAWLGDANFFELPISKIK